LGAIEECEKYDIILVFLPANSTHLTQALDVAFIKPLKNEMTLLRVKWRSTIESLKMTPEGKKAASVPEDRGRIS